MAPEKAQQKIASLSGGEKAKVALTKMLLQKPDVIIMDEPTNHLDILSKESITMMLQHFT
jgi:ATP-binding cassette subfamily F protein 3